MSSKKQIIKKGRYSTLISSIGTLLEQARRHAYSQISQILVKTYWEIGKQIINYEQKGKQKAEYGGRLISSLSEDLTEKYGKGFGSRNLEQMRKFYLLFPKTQT